MTLPFLAAKTRLPAPTSNLVPRPRLLAALDTCLNPNVQVLLKGQRWWWYAVAAGLVIAQLANTPDVTRVLLVVAWVWPILLLSGLGSRESRHNTLEMVFSAPRPVLTQLPAMWLAAFSLMALTGSGALLKFLAMGDAHSILAWLVGAMFVPSLALAFGVLTGSSKAFEIVYVFWMYLILNKVATIDFVGITPESPWTLYLGLSLVLMIVSALVRQTQLKTR